MEPVEELALLVHKEPLVKLEPLVRLDYKETLERLDKPDQLAGLVLQADKDHRVLQDQLALVVPLVILVQRDLQGRQDQVEELVPLAVPDLEETPELLEIKVKLVLLVQPVQMVEPDLLANKAYKEEPELLAKLDRSVLMVVLEPLVFLVQMGPRDLQVTKEELARLEPPVTPEEPVRREMKDLGDLLVRPDNEDHLDRQVAQAQLETVEQLELLVHKE